MKALRLAAVALALVFGSAPPVRAQVVIPDNATAQCTDGTWSRAAGQRGACSAHGGVTSWIGKRPHGAAARCNDGAYWTNATLQGACSSHGGVYKTYKAAGKVERKEMKGDKKIGKP